MTVQTLTDEDVREINLKISDLEKNEAQWRKFIPVKTPTKGKWTHTERFYTMEDVPKGTWGFVKQGGESLVAGVTGYKRSDVDHWEMWYPMKIHYNDLRVSENGRIRTDTIRKIQQQVSFQIEEKILGGSDGTGGTKISNTDVYGMTNTSGVNSGTDGSGNSAANAYTKIKELDDKLHEDGYNKTSTHWLIMASTMRGYTHLTNSNTDATAKKILLENGMINADKIVTSANLLADASDTAAILCEPNEENFYVRELSNYLEYVPALGGAIGRDRCYHGWVVWAGVFACPCPESIAKNVGIASA